MDPMQANFAILFVSFSLLAQSGILLLTRKIIYKRRVYVASKMHKTELSPTLQGYYSLYHSLPQA
ncbi:hypothetical protein M430DRAFT_185193 [Amorphotheca resinae ATCC 22711]|uniref:Uncharacterized protein n=1 Tax=Amorphotheca resinae ATCC 22711 TaxID=857342 RepID=A0A2T3ASD9_AMORE|nr:hypothetical protein M430DRAFT_185193 [Amorphotheca resinae ATCC 22711]PSS09290.1 hypothetical protein M430DRAFT_185193 [Amorphotheca resinae ATCC 22711]